jgi:hemolysin activation/secretion protein
MVKKYFIGGIVTFCSAVIFCCNAFAADSLPSSADPSRQLNEFIESSKTPGGLEEVKPEKVKTTKPQPLIAPKGAENIDLTLKGLQFTGGATYEASELLPYYEKYLNKKIKLVDVYKVAREMTERYVEDGYSLSKVVVPPQRVKEGKITLRMIEAYIHTFEVEGDKSLLVNNRVARGVIEKLRMAAHLNIKELEHNLLVLNSFPGLFVESIIRPAQSEYAYDGGVNIVLVVSKQKKVSQSVNATNIASSFLGPLRLGYDALVNFPEQGFQQVRFNAGVTGQPEELKNFQLSYKMPINASGTMLKLSFAGSKSHPGSTLRASEIEGSSNATSIGLSHPVFLSRRKNLRTDLTLDIQNSRTDAANTLLFNDRIRSLRANLYYDFVDKWKGANYFRVGMSKGLEILDSKTSGKPNLSRATGKHTYIKFNTDMSRVQRFSDKFSLYFSATGQYSTDVLLSAEEFGYGGSRYGRGYDPSEILGDSGVASVIELRHQEDIDLPKTQLQTFAFYDVGAVWQRTDETEQGTTGASAGAGIRMNYNSNLSLELFAAQPLTRPEGNPMPWGNPKSPRVKFSLFYRF